MDYIQQFIGTPVDFTVDFIIPFFLVLSVLVFVHEWGHFYVARLCGVRVETFSIGFGREIFGFTDKKGTRWNFSILPLGGYVKMYGDQDPSSFGADEEAREKFSEADKKETFFNKSVAKRSAIVAAGPAVNFIFAILILTCLYTFMGQPQTPPVAGGVMEGGAAEEAGIQPDDRILAIDGNKIDSFQDIQKAVALKLDQELTLTIERGDENKEKFDLVMTPKKVINEDRFGFKHSRGLIGISSVDGFEMKEFSLGSAFVAASVETWDITVGTLEAIGQIITGARGTEELGGVIRIGALAGEYAQLGFVSFVTFAALLSINLGLLNLFPIPMLDGGHLVFYAFEAVKGKPLSERAQEYFFRFGFACVMALMIFATVNDLVQLNVFEYLAGLVS